VKRRYLAAAVLVAAAILPAGASAATPTGATIYVANDGGGRIDAHDANANTATDFPSEFDSDDDIAAGDVAGDRAEEVVVANDADFNDDTGRIDIHHPDGSKTSFFMIGFDSGDDDVDVGNVVPGPLAEIAVADANHGRLQVFDADGKRLEDFDTSFDAGDAMALADVTGDGLQEVLIANGGDGGGRIDVHDLAEDKETDFDSNYDDGGDGNDQFAAGDVTGDGIDDVLVANTEEDGRIDVHDLALDTTTDFDSAWDSDDEFAVGDATGGRAEDIVVANTEGDGRIDILDRKGAGLDEIDGSLSAYNDGDELTVGAFGGGDLDADGLPDRVELGGIIGKDGEVIEEWNLDELGASPCRKDILVDVDYMHNNQTGASEISHKPKADAIKNVVKSFAAAPVAGVEDCPYPGESSDSGIGLHVDPQDETDRVDYDATLDLPEDFNALKAEHFDKALDPFVHYNVWGSQYDYRDEGITTSGGLANFVPDGQDFVITLGAFANFGSETEQAVDLMHELGHSIGLEHGGDVDVNCKPNYLSVMNYSFVYDGLVDAVNGGDPIVDYSRDRLALLDEDELSEPDGIIDAGPVKTPLGTEAVFNTLWYDEKGAEKIDRSDEPLDWTGDGDETDAGPDVDVNLNDGPDCEGATAGEDLTGFNDWAKLERDGLVPEEQAEPRVELTFERHAELQAFRDQALFPDRATLIQPPKPGFEGTVLGVAMDDEHVYATHQYRTATNPSQASGNGTLVVLDRTTMAVESKIAVGQAPRSVAVNPLTHRAYVVNGGKDSYSLSVIDTVARKVITEIALGQVPVDVAVNTRLNRVYVSNPFQQLIHVIDGATNQELTPIPIDAGPQGMAVDEATGALYVALSVRHGQPHPPLAALGTVIDGGSGRPQVLPRVDLGEWPIQPSDVAVDPDAGRIYVGGLGGGALAPPSVTVLDLATRQQIERISMPGPVRAISLNADAGLVLAAGDRGVETIDGARLKVIRHMDAKIPFSVATATGPGRQLVVGDFKSGEVHRLSYSSGEPR
jgi:YVTN family beta-propeller protein